MQLHLFKENQAHEIIPLACLSLQVLEGHLIFNFDHLDYPYKETSIVICLRNKPIKIWESLQDRNKPDQQDMEQLFQDPAHQMAGDFMHGPPPESGAGSSEQRPE